MVTKRRPHWARQLRGLRQEAGLTQEEAAHIFGKKLRSWAYYEAGVIRPHGILFDHYKRKLKELACARVAH